MKLILTSDVLGLGAPGGEHDLARARAERLRHDVTGLVDRAAGVARDRMRARRVADAVGEEREHRLDRFGSHGRGRRVVQIDQAVSHILLSHDLRVPFDL